MNVMRRILGFVVLGLVVLPVSAGCSKGAAPAPASTSPHTTADNSTAIAEVLAAPVPEGVDPALWGKLTHELAGELGRLPPSRQVSDYSLEWDYLQEFACSSELVDGTRYVIWNNGFFQSDGSQNGAVDVADVTPIAQYFGNSCSYVPAARLADYNRDGKVSVADITPLAVHFGETCSGYRVEISTEARRAGYTEVGTVGYREFTEKNENGFGVHRYAVEASVQGPAWAQVWALDADGVEIEWDAVAIKYYSQGADGMWQHPYFPVNDLAVLSVAPPAITWSADFFVADGNGDGNVFIADITPVAAHWGQQWIDDAGANYSPTAKRADYDRNGIADMLDIECLMDHVGECCSGFAVEVSIAGPTDGFWEDGCLGYYDSTGEANEFGFSVFEYTIQSPPEAASYWVRVTAYCDDYEDGETIRHLGLPSAAVQIGEVI